LRKRGPSPDIQRRPPDQPKIRKTPERIPPVPELPGEGKNDDEFVTVVIDGQIVRIPKKDIPVAG